MHKTLSALAFVSLILVPCSSRAELVLDSLNPGKTLWTFGYLDACEHGNAYKLSGTARKLDSITLNDFVHLAGEFNVTASIYAMPSTIANDDLLTNPLWTSTKHLSYTDYNWETLTFTGDTFILPDELALVFSFTSVSGQASYYLHAYNANDNPPIAPVIGSLNSLAYYSGSSEWYSGWWYPTPDEVGTFYLPVQINASAVPEPFTVGLLAAASLAVVYRKRRRR